MATAEGEGEVFEGVALEVRIPEIGGLGEERRAGDEGGQSVEELPVAFPGPEVRPPDEGREVGPRDVVAMQEHAPAQVVEEDVSQVMRRGEPVGRELEPVGRGHDLQQVVTPRGHVVADLAEKPGRPAEP
ncbi:MAG: hypothetical protein H6Q88_702 [Anaeromyxobacteraceae bacterium]|nr:hypothetical protein [Anaeromyxobacteraceae bacterium]